MPSYFYHLKFELYATADPTSRPVVKRQSTDTVWLPPKNFNIFDKLPSHPFHEPPTPPATADVSHTKPSPPTNRQAPWQSTSNPPDKAKEGQQHSKSIVVDCGAPRPRDSSPAGSRGGNIVVLSERQWRARAQSLEQPPPKPTAGLRPSQAVRDWRFDRVSIRSIDMVPDGRSPAAMKARYVPLETTNTEVGWGIVHLYREGEEAPGLGLPSAVPQQRRGQDQSGEVADAVDGAASVGAAPDASEDKNCTILCIPAVPSYLSPSDFLGFVGERWRDDVSHYRMVMTSRLSRYLVLLKFRDPQRAAEWRREFDGRVFNSMEAQVCQVVFVRSITFETPGGDVGGGGGDGANFPDLSHDPFTPSTSTLPASGASTTTLTLRPFPPPTPSLVELPTCPVCLERMDETTGLMTIPCQHVFHCSCLQKWKGQGCPVCRHTNPSILDTYMSTTSGGASATAGQTPGHHDASANPLDRPFGGPAVSNLCSVCDCPTDLWICLICGNVGCGRYKGGHAKSHWKETAHSFALELETQHVWDYAGDMWVHRLIRDKGDGKVVELPGINKAQPSNTAGRGASGTTSGGHHDDDMDVVPRAKLERIGLEYTHLLTSQLESQRVYFEEMVAKAADKAAAAAANAEKASIRADDALAELRALQAEHAVLRDETVPQLERDLARERARAAKAQDLARELTKSLQEERKLSEGLVARVTHVNARLEEADKRNEELRREIEDLKETNRDLTMFISGQEKLRELEREGKVDQEDVEAGTASVPEDKRRRGKGKGKR